MGGAGMVGRHTAKATPARVARPSDLRTAESDPTLAPRAARRRLRASPPRSRSRPSRTCSRAATCSAAPRPAPARRPRSRCRSSSAWPRAAPTGGDRPVRALVLTPTRELAAQIGESFARLRRAPARCATRSSSAASARARRTQRAPRAASTSSSRRPGRLLDLMQQGLVRFDAASRSSCSTRPTACSTWASSTTCGASSPTLPAKRQTLLFSATMPPRHRRALADASCTIRSRVAVAPRPPPPIEIDGAARVLRRKRGDKRALLEHLLRGRAIEPRAGLHAHQARRQPRRRAAREGAASAPRPSTATSRRARASARSTHFKRGATPRARRDRHRRARHRRRRHLARHQLRPARTCPRATCTASAARPAPAPPGSAISFCDAEERAYLRDIERLIRAAHPGGRGAPLPLLTGHALARRR